MIEIKPAQDPNYHADFCSGCGFKTCKCPQQEEQEALCKKCGCKTDNLFESVSEEGMVCAKCWQDIRTVHGVVCPFCKEEDFDLVGLKHHYGAGWCSTFNETISAETELDALRAKRTKEAA